MLKKIKNWLLLQEETEKNNNPVDAQKKLRDAIMDYFRKHFSGQKTFTVVLWIDNSKPIYQIYVLDEAFKYRLGAELESKNLKVKFEFRTENPPQDSGFSEITEGVYIELKPQTSTEIHSKAKITVFNNKGSLMKYEYMLDGTKQTEYNIGRGENNYNHIVIRENDPVHHEINNCVSREHAKIVFIPEEGFCLKLRYIIDIPVDGRCTPRTIIHRNNQRYKKLETLDPEKLKHNDEIELGDKDNPLFLKFLQN